VAQLIELPLSQLMQPDIVRSERRLRPLPPHVMQTVPYFDVAGVRIWGATAMVLAEFLALLKRMDVVASP
jgi:hypothetical protein